MLRVLTLAGGLMGAATVSQYPEFSQQYVQRMAGQLDALTLVVEDFDASALAAGLTRGEALAQMKGTEFLEARSDDMRRTFARHARLSEDYAAMQAADPLERLMMPHRMGDVDTVQGTWADFEPAMPLSVSGAVSAGVGYLGGWVLIAGVLAMLRWPFRRNGRARA
ncbi:MAG: DUF2937 family protein [Shimia sp.]|uniref:DUF2937 family protein n=1 Tax=Shimia sp. TaxID=1954381 RepID=UPI00405A03D4